jgi:RNA polymerase sigma factor (sigma-70 family)
MSKKILNDDDILSAIYSGKNEDQALEFLYSNLLPKVKRISKKYKANDVDSYDIFQESIIKLYDYVKLKKFNKKYSIESFVLTVTRNQIIDNLRTNSRRQQVDINDFNTPEDLIVDNDILVTNEKIKALEQLFYAIGERCKELLLLRKYDKRSMNEICEIMGFSTENSAKTQIYKCKQKLIKSLEDNPELANEVLGHV